MINSIFSDKRLEEEFLDRFSSLNQPATDHNTSFRPSINHDTVPNGLASADKALDAIKNLREGRIAELDPRLETIIKCFARPSYYIQNRTFDTSNTPHSSELINETVNTAKASIDVAIPKVGRINLTNHRHGWAGSGWIIADNTLVTCRSVAIKFASQKDDGFVFIKTGNRTASAELDTLSEHQNHRKNIYKLRKVLWISPDAAPDVAFLSIEQVSVNGDPQPLPIALMSHTELELSTDDHWISVIGYPRCNPLSGAEDQQQLLDGIYDVKRLQPGKIIAKSATGTVKHDASTQQGNAGSVVLDLETGKAAALQFGGNNGDQNTGISAPVISDLLQKHVLSEIDFA